MLSLKFLFSSLVVVIFSISVLLFYFQKYLIFFPERLAEDFEFNFSSPSDTRWIEYEKKNGDRVRIHALYFKSTEPKLRILYFHGNAGSLRTWGSVAADLAERFNAEVLIVDYPGFGKSSAGLATSAQELFEMSDNVMSFFMQSTNTTLPIVLFGRSLGSGLASHLAMRSKVTALVLETPYTSIKSLMQQFFPWLPVFLLRFDLSNEEHINKLIVPTLILHGTQDEVISFAHAESLKKLNPAVILLSIPHGSHNDLSYFDEYWKGLGVFLQSYAGATILNK